ncbi:hypothetical protein [Natrinema sp. 1APR25-10V2]|uniref:hypothetical protein n=1 Tax=Natrinema sp. 1APR25-10V2 TaxID=2951081 RepID=UPI002874CDA8|nr:hypothetical protein [Natrinema sp. 1APR25-10V2]MDS0474232.1 hypothetical protein [Natrinema sp. 1APR25-10V2]
MDYYDRLLGGMVASLLLGFAAGQHAAVDVYYGLFGGALVATLFLWDAVVRNPPAPATDPRHAAAAVVWHSGLVIYLVTLL